MVRNSEDGAIARGSDDVKQAVNVVGGEERKIAALSFSLRRRRNNRRRWSFRNDLERTHGKTSILVKIDILSN
jgi:hypothetical protein